MSLPKVVRGFIRVVMSLLKVLRGFLTVVRSHLTASRSRLGTSRASPAPIRDVAARFFLNIGSVLSHNVAAVRVFVLGSGSSGNCLVVEAEGERLLIDAGIGPTRGAERMRAMGADLVTSRAPLGVFVTHDHGDHAAQAMPLARALRMPIYAHDGVALDRARRRLEVRTYVPGRAVAVGPFLVESLAIPHDAQHVALRVSAAGRRVAIATDLGHATRELRALMAGSDLVMLEANYCPRLLETGPYPLRLKRRVGGPLGHLSNEQAADLAASLEDTRVSQLVLVHVSRTNNSPERAHAVVAGRLRRLPVEALPHGVPRRYEVARGAWSAAAEQLALAL
jgi:phosphoribosyl 1,2-cyclic phosphodiesterase